MRTLRHFIRESLISEAVGLKQFGVMGSKFGLKYDTEEYGKAESTFLSGVFEFTKTGFSSLSFTNFKSKGGFARAAKAIASGGAAAWRSPVAKVGALTLGIGAAAGVISNADSANPAELSKADALVESFIAEISQKQSQEKKAIIDGLRSPFIVSLSSGAATNIDELKIQFKAHHSKTAQQFIDSNDYPTFKRNFSTNTGYKNLFTHIDAVINDRLSKIDAAKKPQARESYEKLAHRFLICTFVDEEIFLRAMKLDMQMVESKLSDDDKIYQNDDFETIVKEVWRTVTSDETYKSASNDFRDIISGT